MHHRSYSIVLLFLFFATVVSAQNESMLIRKGARLAWQDGTALTKSEIVAMLDSNDYETYAMGRQKMSGSVPLYVVSAAGVGMMVAIYAYENKFYHDLAIENYYSERNTAHRGEDRLVFDITPPVYFYLAQCASFAVSLTTGLLAHRLSTKGKSMIDIVCGNWNAKSARQTPNPTLSLSASPVNFGFTLNF